MKDLTKYFSADAEILDFAGQLEASRQYINQYVSNHTNQMIPELLTNGVLSSKTLLVLINAVYFKGVETGNL